jgi:hypothetical protein
MVTVYLPAQWSIWCDKIINQSTETSVIS